MAAYQARANAAPAELDLDGLIPVLRVAEADLPSTPSPVHGLQETLSVAFTAEDADDIVTDRWSMRRTVTFVVAVCGGFWLALGAAVFILLR